MTPVLQLRNVHKTYPGEPPVEAIRSVSLSVDSGEMLAITGPSGSGKSTLLQLMAALDRATSGEVRLVGRPITGLSERRLSGLRAHLIGVVFQQFFLLDSLSALENVALGLLYRGVPASQRCQRAAEALRQVGLGHRLGHPAGKLSGGERQRAAIARAIVGRPAVVFADEPTGNLDSTAGAGVISLLRALNARGTTLTVITHDAEVAAACTRRVAIRDGQIQRSEDGNG